MRLSKLLCPQSVSPWEPCGTFDVAVILSYSSAKHIESFTIGWLGRVRICTAQINSLVDYQLSYKPIFGIL